MKQRIRPARPSHFCRSQLAARASRLLPCVLWLAVCSLLSCACAPRPAELKAWQPREFMVGVRWAPPAKAPLYAQVARAGFNVIVDRAGPESLHLAHRYGLKLMVSWIGLDPGTFGDVRGRQKTAELIERFRGHPALWGYFLGDRLKEREFEAYGRIGSFVRELDPGHPFYIELLPSDAWVGPELDTADYAGYLARFVRAVRPMILGYAHHPFREKGDGRFYFENLELARRHSLQHTLPLCPTLRGGVWRGMRPLSEGELRWLVYTSLAYGAKGIVWATYWGAPGGSREGILSPDGIPSERYDWIASLNREVRTLGPQLLGLRSVAVYHTGTPPAGATALPPHVLVGFPEGATFLVGIFEDGAGRDYVMVVNKDYRKASKAKMVLNRPCKAIDWLDPADGRWKGLPLATERVATKLEVALRPGGGKLLRLRFAR